MSSLILKQYLDVQLGIATSQGVMDHYKHMHGGSYGKDSKAVGFVFFRKEGRVA